MCRCEKGTQDHYNYECPHMTTFRKNIARIIRKINSTKLKWNLRKKGETEQITTTIAKARWAFNCEQFKVDHWNIRRINPEIIIERTIDCMEILKEIYEKTTKEQETQNNTTR